MSVVEPEAAINALVQFSRVVSDAPDPVEILPALARAGIDRVGARGVAVFRIGERGEVELSATRGLPPELVARCEEVEHIDPSLGDDLGGGHTFLLVSAGGLFGAFLLLFDPDVEVPAWRLDLAAGLADLAAIAMQQQFQTAALRRTVDELRASREELARAEQLKALGQMAAIMAHEVRNPLASFSGALQILRGRFPEAAMERGIIDKLLVRLNDLNQLVGDLLSFARFTEPRREPVPIQALWRDVVSAVAEDAQAKGLEVKVRGDSPKVEADGAMLRGVFLNLLQNAAQAGATRVDVEVRCGNGRCRMRVADDGPGMPEDVRARAFDPFFTTKTRGTGLGLPMAQRVMESHDGSITVDCPEGGGTAFTLTLPVRA